MLNDLFYAVLGMLPWTCALIAALLVLRHFARTTLSARFFRLAWLILAVRLALPVSFAVPVQDRPAPLSIPLPTAAVRQAALPAAPAESGGAQQAAASGPGKAVPVPSAPAPAGPLRSRPGLAGAVWLVGAALCLAARLAAYGTSMRRLRRGRVPLADETLADACRAAFGRSMRVYAVAGLDTPMLAGLLRPAVYLPEGAGLRADTLPYVLAHEARHRSAGDIPFQFVLAAACALHWFDPLEWCMARAARQQAELDALDASNAELEAAANEYAAALQQANARLSAAQAAEQAGAAAFAAKEQEIAAAEREYAEWAAQSDNDAPEYTGGAFYWPLPGYSTGSPMGWRTLNGVQEFHRGMDIPAPLGTKIYAAADGVVSTKAHYTYGTCVKLSHGGGLVTIYAHMSAWAEGIVDGVPVKQGQLIGYVGRTGRAYGYHLHFEANLNGAPVDVRDYLG